MAQLDPRVLSGAATAEELDTFIAEYADDPRTSFELLGAKAKAQGDAGDLLGAAETLQAMATFAADHPDTIRADIHALHWDAADLLREAKALEQAREAYFAALAALTEGAGDIALQNALTREVADVSMLLGDVDFADSLIESTDEINMLNAPPAPDPQPDDPGFVRIPVYYATDRARSGKARPVRFYSGQKGTGVEYGVATVTVPRETPSGTIAAPSIWQVEFASGPAKHVIVQSLTPKEPEGFFASVREQLASSKAEDAFVYIHGYNVTFVDAARRTAQLAYDMSFNGVPLLYSWPSAGVVTGYAADRAAAELSGQQLMTFLKNVAEQSGARRVHIIADGMGNRVLAGALEQLAMREAPVADSPFNQVIFAAPDVDQRDFNDMIGAIQALAQRITLYVSDQDWALVASRKLYAEAARAGDAAAAAQRSDGVDIIDMSELGEDMLTRSNAASGLSAIVDIATLFWRSPEPSRRCGLSPRDDGGPDWVFENADCASLSMINVVGALRNAGAITRDEVRAKLQSDFADQPGLDAFEKILMNVAAP